MPHEHGKTYDVAIVGGGPAGLSAGIWLGRYLHSVVLVDSGDPRNWETRGIHAYLGRPDVQPAELRADGRDTCRRYGVRLIDGCVELVEHDGEERFTLVLGGGERLAARRLLLAIGVKDVWPDIPGLARSYGRSAHVCPDCDGYEARDSRVVVIGVGIKAVAMALALLTWTDRVAICTHGREPRIDEAHREQLARLGVPILTARVRRLHTRDDGAIDRLEMEGSGDLSCDHLFFSLAQYPADDLGAKLGCERDEDGHIVVDHAHHTSVRNVFAAGDITPGPQLALVAAADGAVAALAIHKSLLPRERRLSQD